MRAAVITELAKPLEVREMPDPPCPTNGVVVRVEANGICRTDWHLWKGDWTWMGIRLQLPWVVGHEFCGVVEEVGREVTRWKRGDRVLVPFSQGEGTCEWCRSGHHNVCNTPLVPGVAYGGGFGRLVGVPYADVNLVALPESIPFVDAASMGCRYMTAFHAVVDQGGARPGEFVAVHGCGGVGLSAVQIAAAMGAQVIAVDVDEAKLEAAKAEGAAHTVNAATADAVRSIMALTGGGAHVSLDALGIAATCRNSVLCLRKRGRHVQVGLTSGAERGEISLPIDVMVMKEVQVIGSFGMQAPRFAAMLAMVGQQRLHPGRLVHRTIGLEQVSSVIESMDRYGTLGVTVLTQY